MNVPLFQYSWLYVERGRDHADLECLCWALGALDQVDGCPGSICPVDLIWNHLTSIVTSVKRPARECSSSEASVPGWRWVIGIVKEGFVEPIALLREIC